MKQLKFMINRHWKSLWFLMSRYKFYTNNPITVRFISVQLVNSCWCQFSSNYLNIVFSVEVDIVSFGLFQADSMVSLSDSSSYLAEKLEENEAKVKFKEYFCKIFWSVCYKKQQCCFLHFYWSYGNHSKLNIRYYSSTSKC